MAILLSLLSAFFSSLQSALLANFYRTKDPFSVVAFRGLSLIISMFPFVLYYRSSITLVEILESLPLILLAAVFAAVGNWAIGTAFRFLPIGIAVSFCLALSSIVAIILDFSFEGSNFNNSQILCILSLLTLIVILGFNNSKNEIKNMKKGGIFCTIFGINSGIAIYLVCKISQTTEPLIVGYLWEGTIGLLSLALIYIRKKIFNIGYFIPSSKEFLSILTKSSPTILSTGLFLFASKLASISIVSAILSTQLVFSSLLAIPIEKEYLSRKQFFIIFLIFISLFLLKLSE